MVSSATSAPDVLFVPGAFTGPWMFLDLVTRLGERGVVADVVELPSVGATAQPSGFEADVAAVRAALDALAAPVLLCAHSYGGAVVTAAAAGPHPNVRELVYLAAAAPGDGESMASRTAAVSPADQESPIQVGDDGLARFPREVARQALLNDADDERASRALDELRPMDMSGTDTPIETAAWGQLPYVYVGGADDLLPRAIPDGFLDGAAHVVELPTGHCPHWTQPQLVADVLVGRLR
jgi:pimeloyl-ACP methyl ester carboxylesterase